VCNVESDACSAFMLIYLGHLAQFIFTFSEYSGMTCCMADQFSFAVVGVVR